MEPKSVIEEINIAFTQYLENYFSKRDLPATFEMLQDDIAGFGTGQDEIGFNKNNISALYSRDTTQGPNPIEYIILSQHITAPNEDTGIVSCVLNIKTEIARQQIKLNTLRLSMVFVKEQAAWKVAHMHLSLPTDTHDSGESFPIKELEERNLVLQKLVEEKTRKLEEAIEEISILANTDTLTGIYNRLKLEKHLTQEIERFKRYNSPLSVILLDIDYFKKVNDNFGHPTGDQMLTEFASLINQRLRKLDIFGRWGGEEFLILCTETDLANALTLANSLKEQVAEHPFNGGLTLTASFGVAAFQPTDTLETLIGRADDALYQAKNSGRNQVISKEPD